MQTLYQDENEKDSSREVNLVGIIIHIGRISRYLEGKHFREFRDKKIRICDNGGIFDKLEKEIQ